MKTYLVGGAVRDELLGLEIKDKDHLVVGADIDTMLTKGFRQVGKSFPVFLHPDTGEEYALARTERKTGHGYGGFDFDTAPSVTLEQDLSRRDLTINAIAKDEQGQIHDPYRGRNDLNAKVLRHVSPAFVEDPLRVLRVARFAARFHHLGFVIADETLSLMKSLSHGGELDHLTAERIWQETERALAERNPQVYFDVLLQCGALGVLMPELAALSKVPQPTQWHGGLDALEHSLQSLEQSARLGFTPVERFAVLIHDLGKALTPKTEWPKHHRHEHLGEKPVQALCERLKVPNEWRQLALLVTKHHLTIHRGLELKPSTTVKLLDQCDAWRKPERFNHIINCCQCDFQGRPGRQTTPYTVKEYWQKALTIAVQVDVKAIMSDGFSGAAIRDELFRRRVESVKSLKVKRP